MAIPFDNSAVQCTQFQVAGTGKLVIYWRNFSGGCHNDGEETGTLSVAGETKEIELLPPGEDVPCQYV